MFLLRGGSQWIFNDDSDYYLELARGFLHGCGFAPFSGYCGPAEILRTPGYPLFLIPFFSHYRLFVLVQALLGALRQATGSFTWGFVLLALFAVLCLAVCWGVGSRPAPVEVPA